VINDNNKWSNCRLSWRYCGGGVAGTIAYADEANAASDIYFEAYYPTLAASPQNRLQHEMFRHAFVSGALTIDSSADYAHFWGDAYEAYTLLSEKTISKIATWIME
jgi:hypothetical protein